jgi:hypothetical protein
MTSVSKSSAVSHDAKIHLGAGDAPRGLAFWLGLSAAPIFAFMALWSVLFGSQPDMFCLNVHGSPPMSGMTMMYLLMSIFHAGPWLNVIFDQRIRDARSASGCI